MTTKVTIQDIANELQLSRNTVSKAINNTGVLADATREKILRKAAEMGYKQFAYLPLFQEDAAKAAEPFILPSDKREIAMLTTQFLSSSHFSSTMLDRFQSEINHLHSGMTIHRISPIELKEKNFHLLSTSSAQPASSALKYSTMTTHRCCAIWIFRCCL